jgi:hypothetical protein
LPHYTNIIFPFLAIILASEIVIDSQKESKLKWLILIPSLLMILAIIPISLLIGNGLFIAFGCVLIAVSYFVLIRMDVKYYFAVMTPMIGLALFLNLVFYPFLYSYQGKTQAAYFINKNESIKSIHCKHSYDFEFHLNKEYQILSDVQELKLNDVVFGDSSLVSDVNMKFEVDTIQAFADFHVTGLTFSFLNVADRASVLDSLYLIRVK